MKKINIIKSRRMLFALIFSYVAIMIIPTITALALYYHSKNIVESEVNCSNKRILTHVSQSIDSQVKNIYEMSQQIGTSSKVSELMLLKPPITSLNYYTIYQLVNDLATFKSINLYVKDFYIYFKNSNIIISPESSYTYSLQIVYNQMHTTQTMSYNEWCNCLNKRHVRHFIPLYLKDEKAIDKIMFMQSFSIFASSNNDATVVIHIDPSLFNNIIKNINFSNGSKISIFNKEFGVLYSTDYEISNKLGTYDELKSIDSIHYKEIDGKTYVLSCAFSNESDWVYVVSLPLEEYLEKVTYLQRTMVIAIITCTVLSLLATYLFTKHNYYPISHLTTLISDRVDAPFEGSNGEFSYIKSVILNAFDEKDRLSKQLDYQKASIKDYLIAKLIQGKLGADGLRLLQWHGIYFESDLFAIFLLLQESNESLVGEAFDEHTKYNSQTILGQEDTIASQIVKPLGQAYLIEMNNMIVCLINLSPGFGSSGEEELLSCAHQIQHVFNERFALNLSISISNIHQTLKGIPVAYDEAIEAMDYRVLTDAGQIMQYDDMLSSVQSNSYYYPIETEQKLINYIQSGDSDSVEVLLNDLFNVNFQQNHISPYMARYLMYDIVCTIIKILNNSSIDLHEQLKSVPLDFLFRSQSSADMCCKVISIATSVCQSVAIQNKDEYENIVNNILNFIAQNIHREDLSVAMIAENFQMSPTSMSKYFKKQTGVGLLDYINRYRILCAKELLGDLNLSIKDISEKLGYLSSNTFIRVFKKYEGITPGVYRAYCTK
jgi:two-component system response regulator YesN